MAPTATLTAPAFDRTTATVLETTQAETTTEAALSDEVWHNTLRWRDDERKRVAALWATDRATPLADRFTPR